MSQWVSQSFLRLLACFAAKNPWNCLKITLKLSYFFFNWSILLKNYNWELFLINPFPTSWWVGDQTQSCLQMTTLQGTHEQSFQANTWTRRGCTKKWSFETNMQNGEYSPSPRLNKKSETHNQSLETNTQSRGMKIVF